MKIKQTLIIVFVLASNMLYGQSIITGSVVNEENESPIGYVNIGIVGKNIGTVSDKEGKFSLLIESQQMNDSLLFSCIGFEPHSVKISDIRENDIIHLKEKIYFLNEVVVKPWTYKEHTLGIFSKSGLLSTGFRDNNLGYELGLLFKNKKKAVINKGEQPDRAANNMKRVLLFICIVFCGCNNSKEEYLISYEILNEIIRYHNEIKFNVAETFLDSADTILYQNFVVIPFTSKIINTQRIDSKIWFTLDGMLSNNTKFDKFFDIADTTIIENQIKNNKSQILDTTKLNCDWISYYSEDESYFQAIFILQQYKKDVILFDKPLFNSDNTLALLCYIYLTKPYQITKIVQLRKNLDTSSWNIEKQDGVFLKIQPENNDWDRDSSFYRIYLGSFSR